MKTQKQKKMNNQEFSEQRLSIIMDIHETKMSLNAIRQKIKDLDTNANRLYDYLMVELKQLTSSMDDLLEAVRGIQQTDKTKI